MKKLMIVAALAAVAFASAPVFAGGDSAKAFAEANARCAQDNFRYCAAAGSTVTLEKFIKVHFKDESSAVKNILQKNKWDEKMLKEQLPLRSFFAV